MTASANLPYSGLKILDLSQGIAGPYCAMILLENGAEVIKVEPPAGDWGRAIGHQVEGMSALSTAYNLGKRSICIDA
jgi:crotonobetainyl-CoA:carnitine CoA-transferase CaiB-like acyl-CoA transferase